MAKRKRRSKSAAVSAATVSAIKARKRAFLREVSSLLSDALGFAVRVSMVPPPVDLSPDERRASRRSAADNRRLIAASAFGPVSVDQATRRLIADLNDPLPSSLLGGDADEG